MFDLGGTWFRWGLYAPREGELLESGRSAAISYVAHPDLSADDLQGALIDFVVGKVRTLRSNTVGISLGAPINAHDLTVLGSGPLWGPAAKPFVMHERLRAVMPEVDWHLLNDVSALLTRYMDDDGAYTKTMLITVSSGIGSRLYDHRARRIPYDATFGVQGEIGHLKASFELEGHALERRCECGGANHLNAFASGRAIAQTLRELPALSRRHTTALAAPHWEQLNDEHRLARFHSRLEEGCEEAQQLLDAFVTPLSRVLATALCLDPDIDRIVLTGGVVHGLGRHYREALQRTFIRDELYEITPRDPHYLARRLKWEETDDYAGLLGAGAHAVRMSGRDHGD